MKKYKILYVDDEESNLRIFKDTFRRKYDVYTATSASKGIKILEENEIELVLSDQRMPEMTGIEFLRYTFEKYPKTNRILITGYSDFDAVENAINQAKVFQYVQKPWKEDTLDCTIQDALRIYQLEEENARQKQELIVAKGKAEKSDKLKTEFLNNLSHEIRTPLNGITGFVELLDDPNLIPGKRKEYIGIIQSCSEQLLTVINEILEYSELITSSHIPEFEEISINKLLDELFAVFNMIAKENDLSFILSKPLEDKDSVVITDNKQLLSILTKILDNAFKFTISGTIKLGYNLENERIVFYVSDTGVGIDKDFQEIIFNRFSKANEDINIKSGGFGIGLSIARENAKLINADIWLKSKKGEGSIFYISIPYKGGEMTDKVIKNEQADKPAFDNGGRTFKILIAEDERINYIYLEILLNKIFKNDIKVFHAFNGQEAIRICEKNPDLDLIFMDIKMPLLNGYEATKTIKGFMTEVPVIAQTAYSTQADKEKAFESGFDDFISKPVYIKELELVLSKFLQKSKKEVVG